jgi:hypothetical protein
MRRHPIIQCLVVVVLICRVSNSAAQSNSPVAMVSFSAPHASSSRVSPAAGGSDTAGVRLFGPPPCCWQKLPFKTEIPAAARTFQSNAMPTGLYRSVEERELGVIQRLAREGGLRPGRQSERRLEEQMSRTQFFQPDVSFSGDQINILKTMLR